MSHLLDVTGLDIGRLSDAGLRILTGKLCEAGYGDRVLGLDSDAAQRWGRLRVPHPSRRSTSRLQRVPFGMTSRW